MGKLLVSYTQLFLIVTIVAASASGALAADVVSVATRDGRNISGEIDTRSTDESLWVRRSEENIVLTTAVGVAEIDTATLNGEPIAIDELVQKSAQLATSGPTSFLTEYEVVEELNLPHGDVRLPLRVPAITTFQVDAFVANLDYTVETDGLIVAIAPLDVRGNPWPVRGNLSARLIVERLDRHTGQVSFEEFHRWSVPLMVQDFEGGIAELPLRFRRVSPEFDWQLCTAALLNVRLGVYGGGNFEASIPVQIQEFNPIRDEMRNQQGSRFFRNELTHNTLQDGPRRLHQGYSAPRGMVTAP